MSSGSAPVVVRDNPEALRYELVVDGDVAGEIRYRRSPDRIALVHTEVSPSPHGLRAVPICPFVSSYVQRHPEYGDLVAPD